MLKYKKMSLFDAPPGSILMHGCNAQGVWGRGIAAEFKRRFSASYAQYTEMSKMYLRSHPGYGAVGNCFLTELENSYRVACLITSFDYGDIDTEDTILLQSKDIGNLMKEASLDALTELEPVIKEQLFRWAWPRVARAITGGLPQWYKEELAKQQFGEDSPILDLMK